MTEKNDVGADASETGEESESNLGAYMLTVGLVSIAFGSVFSLVFSGPVALLLLAVVIGIAIVSMAVGFYADTNLLFPRS